MILARIGALMRPPLEPLVVPADVADLNLYVFATSQGYSSGPVAIAIPAGVEVYGSDALIDAIVPGPFDPGTVLTLIVKGTVTGAGGDGGNGSPGDGITPATAGQRGGHAINAAGVSGFTFRLDRQPGSIIRSGGGAGGGAGAGLDPVALSAGLYAGGGGGGGGQGRTQGSGGLGKPSNGTAPVVAGTNGATGATRVGGAGGLIGNISTSTGQPYTGGTGGAGGVYGAAGSIGLGGSPGGGDEGAGGAAGKSINGIANVVVISTGGTLIGPTA